MRASLLTIPALSLLALGNQACGLISADFEGEVKLLVKVEEMMDTRYFGIEKVNPEDNQDYRENKDRINEGRIEAIDLEFVALAPTNEASLVAGQVDVRKSGQGDDAWIMGAGAWEGIQVLQNNKFRIKLPVETQEAANKLLFEEGGELDVRLAGIADRAPIQFDLQILIHLVFTASL